MANVLRRLRKLEARVTDRSGLVPHSGEWLDHWFGKVDAVIRGEDPGTPGCIPLEAVDAIIATANHEGRVIEREETSRARGAR